MSEILLINTRPTRNYRSLDLHNNVASYFKALNKLGPKMGDTRTEPNNGLLIIGNSLLGNGHTVEYLDINHQEYNNYLHTGNFYSLERIITLVEESAADSDYLFFSAIITGIDDTLRVIDAIKKLLPDKVIFLGGTFPSLEPMYCMNNCSGIDALVIGEGEQISNTLIEAYNSKDFSKLENASGLIFRTPGSEGYIKLPGHNMANIEELGPQAFPAWDLLSTELGPHVYRIMTSRGCGFHCSFCVPSHMSGHTVRRHRTDDVIDAIKRIKYEFNAENYVIGDLTFLYNKNYGHEILHKIISEKIELPFWCQTHLSRITEENVQLLKNAGCTQIAIGIESISPSVLSNINKGINEREIVEKLLLVKRYGIESQCYFIIGLPGDGIDTIELNKQFIKYAVENKLIDRTHIGLYVPYPGTTIDPSIEITNRDYSFYTQGVFADIPSRSVASNTLLTSDDITAAYEDCLHTAGEALSSAASTIEFSEDLILGAETISVIERARSEAGNTRKTVFNIVQGVNNPPNPFISNNIFENSDYVVGSAEVYTVNQVKTILGVIMNRVDLVLFDAGRKSNVSEAIVNCTNEYSDQIKIIWYSDTQTWLRTVQDMMLYHSRGTLINKNIMLAPNNEFTGRLQTQLNDFCKIVDVVDSEADKNYKYDFLVTYGELKSNEIKKLLNKLNSGGFFIDSKICAVDRAVLEIADANNIKILRPDMRHHILSEILIGTNYNEFVTHSVGKKNIDGIQIVSGGHLGEKDDIIVDSVHKPRAVLGIADGSGRTIPFNKLEPIHKTRFSKIKNIIESGNHDK